MYCTEKLFFSLSVLQIGMWFCFFPPPFSASHLLEPSLSLPGTVIIILVSMLYTSFLYIPVSKKTYQELFTQLLIKTAREEFH